MPLIDRSMIVSAIFMLSGLFSLLLADELSLSDKRFLKNAAQAGQYEVAGSRLAFKKSKDTDLLRFAKMMTEDHGEAASKLKTLAAEKGVALPREPSLLQQAKLKFFTTRDGLKFDQSYAANIGVSAHEQAVELFEEAAEDVNDADIRKFAHDTLPTLKKHLEEANKLGLNKERE